MKNNKIAIIGAGPAGIAAAIQLRRFGFNPLLFEQDPKAGSLLTHAWRIENYLGTFNGISGIELLELFRNHLRQNEIEPIFQEVLHLDFDKQKNQFSLCTASKIYEADRTIAASGTAPKTLLQIENAQPEIKKFLFYSPVPLFKQQKKAVAIIGAGDAAFDYAVNLAERGNKVELINSGKRIKALPILQKKVQANENIIYRENQVLKTIRSGKNKNLHCLLENNEKSIYIDVDYLIAAVGRLPRKNFYSGKLISDEEKLLSQGLLYLCGDVKNAIYRQVAIAVADGIRIAMKIRETA